MRIKMGVAVCKSDILIGWTGTAFSVRSFINLLMKDDSNIKLFLAFIAFFHFDYFSLCNIF